MRIAPILLSGGSGTRLWPLSRVGRPKQFLPLTDENSLYQLTLLRLQGLPGVMPPAVVCNEAHRFVVGEQAAALGLSLQSILLEPVGRNTAPAIALAALRQLASGDDALLLVLPCDHVFTDVAAFQRTVVAAVPAAVDGSIVTFGIVPRSPETGYGYVKAGAAESPLVRPVEKFVEKPDRATAESYVASGCYFWNSGMFLVKASVYMAQLRAYAPDIAAVCEQAFAQAKQDLDFCRVDAAAFAACRSESIDYAVMEKTDRAAVVPLDAGWSDVGSWSAVWDVAGRDEQQNACRGDVLLHESNNNYVHADARLVALLGVDDLVVVETADAVLVTTKDRSQDVKRLVDQLKEQGRGEVDQHREVFRPWGSYDAIGQGSRYQVKRITVKPGARLSVQLHHHRAEHWVVVSGTALVRIGDQEKIVTENQSVYIPIGMVHCLENPGKVPLHLIEVQSGSYLGEDDIIRLDDRYGRT